MKHLISTPCRAFFHPRSTEDLRSDVLPWVDKWVTVESWHSLMSDYLKENYPNDEWVGFVSEFNGDIPQSELFLFEPETEEK